MSIASANPGTETLKWDVFLCYASEDEKKVVEPLYQSLTRAGITCWYAPADIKWGESIPEKIMEGLSASRYVMVILTPDFLKKHYGRFELLTSINDEASTGRVRVLPLIRGTESQKEEILGKLLIVGGKRCLHWNNDDPRQVIDALRERLSGEVAALPAAESAGILPLVIGGRRRRVRRWVKYLFLLAVVVALAVQLPWLSRGRPPVVVEPEMVLIQGGPFQMGVNLDEAKQFHDDDPAIDETSFADAMPRHEVNVGSFYISKTEVTNRQYEEFLAENPGRGVVSDSDPNNPVAMVSWHDAKAYCEWLSKKTGKRYRLPTEAEWEKAARGSDGRKFPWGDEPPDADFLKSQRSALTRPVGTTPSGATPDGLLDMAGNVAEWCSDWYSADYYKSEASQNPKGPGEGERKVVRGGSSKDPIILMHCAARFSRPPETTIPDLGFRVVKEF